MALCEASKEALYLRQLFTEVGMMEKNDPALLMEDNQACKPISEDAQHHHRAKHIGTQYHFSRECQDHGKTKVLSANTQRQLADYLTKYLNPIALRRLRLAAFGYNTKFHKEDPKSPLETPISPLGNKTNSSSMNKNKLNIGKVK